MSLLILNINSIDMGIMITYFLVSENSPNIRYNTILDYNTLSYHITVPLVKEKKEKKYRYDR
jgi:hypothetical protein